MLAVLLALVMAAGGAFAPPSPARAAGERSTAPDRVRPAAESLSAPEGVEVVALGSNEVLVTWAPPPEESGITRYTVRRNGEPIALVDGGTIAYIDRSTQPLQSYSYSLVASDDAGDTSPASSAVSATTPACTSCKTVTVRPASDVSGTGFTPNAGTTRHTQLDETTPDYDGTYIKGPTSGTANSVHGLTPVPAGTVRGVTVRYTAKQHVSSGQPGSMNVRVELYDGAQKVGTGATRNLPASYSTYTDTFAALAVPSAANLRVKIIQESPGSSKRTSRFTAVEVWATYDPTDTTAPTTPSDLDAAVVSETAVDVSWSPSVDARGVQGYRVYRDGVVVNPILVGGRPPTDTPTFTFDGGTQGFVSSGTASSFWEGGNPDGGLGGYGTSLPEGPWQTWTWTGTWEELGATPHSTVSAVALEGLDLAADADWPSLNLSLGTVRIEDGTGQSLGTLFAGLTLTAAVHPWQTVPPQPAVTFAGRPSSSTVRITLNAALDHDSYASTSWNWWYDNLKLELTTDASRPRDRVRFRDTGLTPDTTYAYTVVAVDAAGNASTAAGPVAATPTADPNRDTDNDDVPDGFEDIVGGDPSLEDTDGDGLTDGFETIWGGMEHQVPLADTDGDGVSDASEDVDGDDLSAIEEQVAGSDPLVADTDRDGIEDGDEVAAGTNPIVADTDSDGSGDGAEPGVGTDPLDPDSDDDGILDGAEIYTETVDGPATVQVELTGGPGLAAALEVRSLAGRPAFSDALGQVSPAWEISLPTELQDGLVDAELTLPYDPATAGAEADLRIFTLDAASGMWLPAANDASQVVDPANDTVTATVTHFSVFAVFNIVNWHQQWTAVNQLCLADPVPPGGGEDLFIDLVFTLDSSGSMISSDPDGLRKQASKNFVDALLPEDRAGVVDFDSFAILRSPLTSDFTAVKAAIDLVDSSGGTNIGVGVDAALDAFDAAGQDPGRGRVMILLTDGGGSYDHSLTTRASQSLVTIYTVGLGSFVDTTLLTSIAEGTGGQYFPVDSADDLPNVFREIGGEIDDGVDTDGDGLTDCEEVRGMPDLFGNEFFSNPSVADTDGDEVPDGVEIGDKLDHNTIQVFGVSLADLLGTDYSYAVGSDPQLTNTDGDLINPEAVRLDDAAEFSLGTNARLIDSDGDGFDDVMEVLSGLDANDWDTDGDGLGDFEEMAPADPNQGSDPLVFDEYRTSAEFRRLYEAGFWCGAWEGDCWLGQERLVPGGPMAHETWPFAMGMIVSAFGGTPFDIRDLLASVAHLDAIGTVLGLVGFIPLPVLPDIGEAVARAARAAAKLPASRLPNLIRGIRQLDVEPSVADDLVDAVLGAELAKLTDAGMSPAGKARLLGAGTDMKALAYAIDRAAQKNLTARFMDSSQEGEQFVRSGDILGTGGTFNFLDHGKGLADPSVVDSRNGWRIVDAFDPVLRLARESKVGYQCQRAPKCVDRIIEQIRRDKALLASEDLLRVEWHFFPSNTSGKIGADQRIIDALIAEPNPIDFYIHLP